MIYVWARSHEIPQKMIGGYEYYTSPDFLLFRQGEKIDLKRLERCLLYTNMKASDLADESFLRNVLRPSATPAYLMIEDAIYYFDCTMINQLNIAAKQLDKLKSIFQLGNADNNTSPRELNDNELALIKQYTAHYFSRTPMVTFSIKSEKLVKFDCLATNICAPLVNERVKQLLEKSAPNDVQFFPAKLICKDGELVGYFFVNIISTFVGIDYEKSTYTQSKNSANIFYFTKVVYKPGCMGKHFIARDKHHLDHLLVSEQLKQLFEKEKITGVDFVPPEIYYHPLSAADLIAEEQAILRENEAGDE